MRNKLFLFLLLFGLLAGCQNSEPADPAVVAQLQGSWVNTAVQQEYYDAAGKLVHEEAQAPAGRVYRFKDNSLTILLDSTLITNDTTSRKKTLKSMSFKVSRRRDGATVLTFTLGGSGTSGTVIKSVSDEAMVWEDTFDQQPYQDTAATKTASKAVIRHLFTRRR